MEIDESVGAFGKLSNEHSSCSVFQTALFFDVLQRAMYNPFTLTVVDNGEAVAGLLGYVQKSSFFSSRIFFRVIGFEGPIMKKGARSDALGFLLESLSLKARQLQAMTAEIAFAGGTNPAFNRERYFQYEAGGEYSAVIDLSKEQQVLWNDLRRDCQKNILQASRRGIEAREVQEFEELRELYDVYLHTALRRKFVPHPFSFFKAVWDTLCPRGKAAFSIALFKNRIIAGRLNFTHDSKTTTFASCSLNYYWRLRPNHLLMWHTALQAKEKSRSRHFIIANLPRSRMTPCNIDYYTFKTSFGGQLVKERTYYRRVVSRYQYELLRVCDRFASGRRHRLLAPVHLCLRTAQASRCSDFH